MSNLKQCYNHCHQKPKVFNSLFIRIEINKTGPKTNYKSVS